MHKRNITYGKYRSSLIRTLICNSYKATRQATCTRLCSGTRSPCCFVLHTVIRADLFSLRSLLLCNICYFNILCFLSSQSAIFNFQSLLTVILLLICTCAYLRAMVPNLLDKNKTGYVNCSLFQLCSFFE